MNPVEKLIFLINMKTQIKTHIKHPQTALYTQTTNPDSCLSHEELVEKLKLLLNPIEQTYEKTLHKIIKIILWQRVETLHTRYKNKKIKVQVNIKKIVGRRDITMKDSEICVTEVKTTIKNIKSKTPLKYISIVVRNNEYWKFDGKNFIDVLKKSK